MSTGDKGAIECVKPALYLTDELHRLYIQVAQTEHQVYKGFRKKKKAQKAIDAFDKVLSRTLDPYCQIIQSVACTKAQGKVFAESVVRLYELFVSLNESRIDVLREFKQNGMSPKVYALNEKSLAICGDYDKLFPVVKQQAENLHDIFSAMGLFEILDIDT